MPALRHLLVPLCCLMTASAFSATRWDEYTTKYQNPTNPVTIVTAGCFGGSGSEWLAAGGFQADGTVVVAGSSIGPALELPGMAKITVLGSDGPAPTPPASVQGGRKGNSLGWQLPQNTAFIVSLDDPCKQVVKAIRFPWGAGGLTNLVVAKDDSIYIAGHVGPKFSSLGRATQAKGDASGKNVYLAKLDKGLTKLLWLVEIPSDSSRSPTLALDDQGRIHVTESSYHLFDDTGKQLNVMPLPDKDRSIAVNPQDGTWARGGDRNTHTGREPWRQPYLNIFDAGGKQLHKLYGWNPKEIGADGCRLVSDSSIRQMHYTPDGKYLWMIGWSDGGNSVLNGQPFDYKQQIKSQGLGISAWGAGVLSVCYILKMDTGNNSVVERSLWLAYLKDQNKPNGIGIDMMKITASGALVAAGGSASGLIQTGDNLYHGPTADAWAPGGPYVTIFEKDLSGLRFSSVISATEAVTLADDKTRWGIGVGTVGRRERVIYVGGAVKEAKTKYDAGPQSPPEKNPLQKGFGGGECDGWLMVLEL